MYITFEFISKPSQKNHPHCSYAKLYRVVISNLIIMKNTPNDLKLEKLFTNNISYNGTNVFVHTICTENLAF